MLPSWFHPPSPTHKSQWLLWHTMWYVIMCVLVDWFPTAWCVNCIHDSYVDLCMHSLVGHLGGLPMGCYKQCSAGQPNTCLLVNTLIIWVWINSRTMSELRYLVRKMSKRLGDPSHLRPCPSGPLGPLRSFSALHCCHAKYRTRCRFPSPSRGPQDGTTAHVQSREDAQETPAAEHPVTFTEGLSGSLMRAGSLRPHNSGCHWRTVHFRSLIN